MLPTNVGIFRQYAAAVSAALSAFIVGTWIAWPSSAVKNILAGETQLNITRTEVSWAVALLDLGNVLSPIPSSYISDWLGRKFVLVILSFVLFATWLLAIFGTTAYYLYTARLTVGICKGLVFTVMPIYLGEIASTNIRGGVGTIFCSMMNYGILFELCVGSLVSYDMLNILSSPFSVLFLILFFNFPESPYYFLMKGRQKEATKSLAWFRNLDENSPVLQQELAKISVNVEEDMKERGNFKDLINSSSARKAMFISMGLALIQRLGGMSSIIAFSVVTLPKSGGYFRAETYMIIFGVTAIIGQSVCVSLIDKLGRKPLLVVSCLGCGVSTGLSAVFYWLQIHDFDVTNYNWVPYCCVILYGIMFAVGIGTIPSILVVELFSSDTRSYAASIAAIFYAVGSFIINKMYLYVQETFGVYLMFLFFTISSLLGVIFICLLFFETNGKSFTEIQSILKKENSRTVLLDSTTINITSVKTET